MYHDLLEPSALCGDLGACEAKSLVTEPTCEQCVGAIAPVIESILNKPEKLELIFLSWMAGVEVTAQKVREDYKVELSYEIILRNVIEKESHKSVNYKYIFREKNMTLYQCFFVFVFCLSKISSLKVRGKNSDFLNLCISIIFPNYISFLFPRDYISF